MPEAIGQARRDLAPGDPGEVLAALTTLASRRGFDLPDGLALELDIEVMAGWPRDLWRKAFRGIWERFAYRRIIEADLADRRSRLDRLKAIRLKLETIELKRCGTKRRGGDDPAREACRRQPFQEPFPVTP